MAPKRRKKAGLTRMDAALDQMSVFGFSRQLVRKTVGNLLKLYGNDGWKLIEEDAYRVLLDVILEEQETAQTHNLLMDESSTKLASEDSSLQVNNSVSLTNNAESSELEVPLLLVKEPGNQEHIKDTDLDLSSFDPIDEHSDVNTENTPLSLRACDAVNAPVNVHRKRKPCYGWISDDDNDDDTKFITLAPAT
ncbi:hypothetical protein R6Q59_012327 [Mikania micrantha]|uniref:WIYLD domain-containing protein n=1 Tax=Mikania micrantha TaxID=192012 RepID=A0A5N6LMA5_9ASTR|nr:hypothetical protein E3N88_40329 [Mikania micrantha]